MIKNLAFDVGMHVTTCDDNHGQLDYMSFHCLSKVGGKTFLVLPALYLIHHVDVNIYMYLVY